MTTVKLGNRPKTFPCAVKFPMLDGSTGTIKFDFVYRTKTEHGAFIDAVVSDAKAKDAIALGADGADSADAPVIDAALPFSMAKLMTATVEKNGEYLCKIATGWSLDVPFGPATAQQLADELPAAVAATMEAYRAAITEGRLGN
jgi:hypothetical protein